MKGKKLFDEEKLDIIKDTFGNDSYVINTLAFVNNTNIVIFSNFQKWKFLYWNKKDIDKSFTDKDKQIKFIEKIKPKDIKVIIGYKEKIPQTKDIRTQEELEKESIKYDYGIIYGNEKFNILTGKASILKEPGLPVNVGIWEY